MHNPTQTLQSVKGLDHIVNLNPTLARVMPLETLDGLLIEYRLPILKLLLETLLWV
jgi:hypothetical protein